MKKRVKKTTKEMLMMLPEDAARLIEKEKIHVVKNTASKSGKEKYTKQRTLGFYQGYDYLENMIVVRQYIQKKYKLNIFIIEMIMFLFPKNYFTLVDYRLMPKQFHYRKIESLINLGLVTVVVPGENRGKHLYSLSRQGKEIVKLFYEYLSGEKKIPEDTRINAFARKNACPIDKKKMELIKILNQQEPSENKKASFK